MSNISLSEDQKQKIKEIAKNSPELIRHRANLILAYAEGEPTMQAAKDAGMSRGRARYWKRQFISRGMDIFTIDSSGKSDEEDSLQSSEKPGDEMENASTPAQSNDDQLQQKGDFPFPLPQKSVGILPDDSLAEAAKKVWLYNFAIMLSHEKGTILGEDNEELHDMRVATRRMRSAFDIFMPAFNPKIMKRYLNGLRGIGRALGQVRDMDVLLEKALKYQGKLTGESSPGIEPLLDDWRHQIEKKRLKLIEHLQSPAYQQFKQEFSTFLQTPDEKSKSGVMENGTSYRVRDIIPVLVYSRYAAVRAYEGVLPMASVSQLHALRIEYKKFRYALEYFKEILGDSAGEAVNEIKGYQDHLGELNDADVACKLVNNFLKHWEEKQSSYAIQERASSGPVVTYLAYLHGERYRLMVAFPEIYKNFCRPEFRQYLAQAIALL